MIRQAHITVLAFRHPAAGMALYHRSETATVLEQDNLLLTLQCLFYLLDQCRRERPLHPLLMRQFLDVNPFYMRKPDIFISFFQLHQAIFTGSGIKIGFHTGRSCSQQDLCLEHRRQHDGRTTGMVTWGRVLLFIRILMFLIYDDQPQVTKRQKDRGTNSENHIITLLSQLFLPDLHPLGIRELGMINTQPMPEHPFQTLGNLSGQCDFRKQIQDLFSCFQHFLNEVDINFRLATGCDTMQQTYIFLCEALKDIAISLLLRCIQRIYIADGTNSFIQPPYLLIINLKDFLFNQSVKNGRSTSRLFKQLFLCHFL